MGFAPVVLLDRDGTINVERNYLSDPDALELLPNAAAGLRLMQGAGAQLVVLTNQSAIGRGYFDESTLDAIHDRLRSLLAAEGVEVHAKIYVCPHTPDDGCTCRKPMGGLVEQAAADLDFDPAGAFVIGDKASDIELGQRFDATTILARTGYGELEAASPTVWPDFVVDDLVGAAQLVTAIAGDGWRIRRHVLADISTKRRLLEECETSILSAADAIARALGRGGKLLICGNGGSAADAQHLAAEFVSLLDTRFPRPGLPALALTTDSSFLTAYSNDFDFAGVFERQVQALGQAGDVVLGISTSGNSENVVRALRCARERGLATVALMGAREGAMARVADVVVRVPSTRVQRVQESHLAIEHLITELVERSLFGATGHSM